MTGGGGKVIFKVILSYMMSSRPSWVLEGLSKMKKRMWGMAHWGKVLAPGPIPRARTWDDPVDQA